MKRCVKIWNMFLLSLRKKIYKSASLGIRNLKREGKNGTSLILNLAFTPENWTFQWKQGSFFVLLLFQHFLFFKIWIIQNNYFFFVIGCVASLLVRSLCLKRPYNFIMPLCFVITNRLLWESLIKCLHNFLDYSGLFFSNYLCLCS
jgi:hypothetical protein